ncbi:MAG TPA: thioredoxin family protein [Puia sp.]|jgi:thiol:disulfide interchange protein DsbD
MSLSLPTISRRTSHGSISGAGRRFCFLTIAFFVASLFLGGQRSFAQADTTRGPVSWEFSTQQGADGKPVLVLHAHILDGWRLYSTTMADSLPNSRVTLDSSAGATVQSIDEKGQLKTQKEALFSDAGTRSFTGDAEWLVHLQPVAAGAASATGTSASGASASGTSGGSGASSGDLKGTVTFMAIYKDSVVGPIEVPFRYAHTADGGLVAKAAGLQGSASAANELKKASIDLANPVNKCGGTGAENSQSKGMLGLFFLGILGGLVGLIMPCTFPMIPLTVSFFTKRSGSRSKGIANAFLYGFFIFLIYVLISVPFYFLKANNANILNNIATNVWLNLFFTAVFLAFALSFFGLFEITLPSSISNSVDTKSNISSIGGIFFMALTLAVVSFSCTGPILGTFVVSALGPTGGPVQLTVVLAGFGFALGLPFALFALFPSWLQSLPRSGSWMNTVKIFFGFVELALALKYFSNADLVTHWGILKRETFFALWILVSVALSLYLFGVIKFHHDPPPKKLSKTRIALALVFLAFGLYLAPGLTNTKYANISLVSGFPPPFSYSLYGADHRKGIEANVVNDYDKALALAKQQHKPILIDFTGWACVNCRKMEENVWPQDIVKEKISEDYILVSLYVDDRKVLPDDQQFLFTTGDGSKKEIRTVGDKFATLQSENFKNASQPFYVVISPDEKLLNYPVGYTPNAKEYAAWLQCGLDAYKKQN